MRYNPYVINRLTAAGLVPAGGFLLWHCLFSRDLFARPPGKARCLARWPWLRRDESASAADGVNQQEPVSRFVGALVNQASPKINGAFDICSFEKVASVLLVDLLHR
jgi:hypothetical protein